MRKFLESWGGALAIGSTLVVAVGGATWLIATSIGQVRTDLIAEIGAVRTEIVSLEVRMEKRLSTVEAKLDLLIEALNIRAGED